MLSTENPGVGVFEASNTRLGHAWFRLGICPSFKEKNREFTGRLLLILPIGRKHGHSLRPSLCPLITSQQSRCGKKPFVSDFNRDIGMSQPGCGTTTGFLVRLLWKQRRSSSHRQEEL
jgi:hypothetical protein